MSGLDAGLLSAAVEKAVRVAQRVGLGPEHAITAGIFAGLEVIAEEFGPRQEDVAPPVRELPTEPGAVILVTGTMNASTRRPMFLANDGWHYVDNDGDACTRPPGSIAWQPATVVSTAAYDAAVKALRDVVELLNGPQSEDVQEAQDAAINALATLDGSAAS